MLEVCIALKLSSFALLVLQLPPRFGFSSSAASPPGSMALPLTLAALLTASAATVTIPPELYAASALSKVLAVANSTSAPTTWPEYTADGGDGWELEPLTDWTSSFFPLSLYTLAARDQLCPSVSSAFPPLISRREVVGETAHGSRSLRRG